MSGNMEPTDGETLFKMLPNLKKELDYLNSDSFVDYENKLTKATVKSIQTLENIIDDGTLALDPEQLVKAVQVLTKSKMDIMDSKRRMLETMIRGEAMMKAIEPPKDKDKNSGNSVLLDYMQQQGLLQNSGDGNSIFQEVNKLEDSE